MRNFTEELAEALILADVGVETSVELVERLRDADQETQKIDDLPNGQSR